MSVNWRDNYGEGKTRAQDAYGSMAAVVWCCGLATMTVLGALLWVAHHLVGG